MLGCKRSHRSYLRVVPIGVRLHVCVADDYTPAVSAVHRCKFGGFETLPLYLDTVQV